MKNTIAARDIKYIHCNLNMTREDSLHIFEQFPQMELFQENANVKWHITKAMAILLLGKDKFWNGVLEASRTKKEVAVSTNYDCECVIFKPKTIQTAL